MIFNEEGLPLPEAYRLHKLNNQGNTLASDFEAREPYYRQAGRVLLQALIIVGKAEANMLGHSTHTHAS